MSCADIAIDSHLNPTTIRVYIKCSKTDQFHEGIHIYISKTDNDLCLVAAMVSYLAHRPSSPGPLFILKDGRVLTKSKLIELVRQALQQAGIQSKTYSGHSFRIGAATTAAARGIPESLIKTLGRWKSDAYQAYIKLPIQSLAQVSQSIAI